jgi:hypothetical protein
MNEFKYAPNDSLHTFSGNKNKHAKVIYHKQNFRDEHTLIYWTFCQKTFAKRVQINET